MNTFGRIFRVSIFGESHGKAIGVVLDGVRPGLPVSESDVMPDILRRKSGAKGTTSRLETDEPEILSGVLDGFTTGAPMTIIFHNGNVRPDDYKQFKDVPRPGHADYTANAKWLGFNDSRGGGHFSGRLTLPIVAATALSIDSTCQYTEDELEYHRYRATWAKNDKEILQVVFPKNWQLMSGCDMPELEASFERRLVRHHMADLSPLPVKGSWIVTPQMSSKLYLADGKERRTDKHSRSYVCSSRQITHSVRNLMLADDMEHEVQMEVHMVRYGFATDTLRLPLKKFLNYCRKEEGCSPYFGIKSRTADSTEGLLLLANPQGGFMHMLSVTIDDQVIAGRKGMVRGKLYPYIPIYNVRKEYLNLTEYENPD